MAFKIAYFLKNRLAAGGFAPRPPSLIRLSYTSSFTHVSQFTHFHFSKPDHGFWPFILFLFRKFLITSLQCNLGPQSKILATPMARSVGSLFKLGYLYIFPQNVMLQLYYALVLPMKLYGIILWRSTFPS